MLISFGGVDFAY